MLTNLAFSFETDTIKETVTNLKLTELCMHSNPYEQMEASNSFNQPTTALMFPSMFIANFVSKNFRIKPHLCKMMMTASY